MKLRDVPIHRAPVDLSSGHRVEVRGINASDLMLLTTMFGPQIAMAYGAFHDELKKGDLTQQSLMRLIAVVAKDAPKLLGWIIAIANDDPDDEAATQIGALPIVDQAVLLNEIAMQTFANEATVKKLSESLSSIYLTISGALTKEARQAAPQNTPSGTGASEDR
jgi:hypothetical protein